MDFSTGEKADTIRQKFTQIVEKNKAVDTIVRLHPILSEKKHGL